MFIVRLKKIRTAGAIPRTKDLDHMMNVPRKYKKELLIALQRILILKHAIDCTEIMWSLKLDIKDV